MDDGGAAGRNDCISVAVKYTHVYCLANKEADGEFVQLRRLSLYGVNIRTVFERSLAIFVHPIASCISSFLCLTISFL